MSVTITGASDDLIEIDGDIREEFTAPTVDEIIGGVLAFSDGTVLSITLTDEMWRIHTECRGPHSGDLTITQAVAGDPDNYTDQAVIKGPIRWVVLGTDLIVARPVSTAGPELQAALGEGLTLTAHATGVVTRPDGTVRDD
jgi:hypothetical protein